jgi:signal transduction histidine kinase
LQAQKFINVFGQKSNITSVGDGVTPDDLFILAQRILGRKDAQILFNKFSQKQGRTDLPDITVDLMETLEQKFAGSVGAATAHSMITQAVGNQSITVEDLIAVADETVQVIEYSARLEEQSKELTRAAAELMDANSKLTELGTQKDEFLSHVSHELRTPMTSIRSFSEILQSNEKLDKDQLKYFSTIINDESKRLTRLLDEILDLSFLESGQVKLNISNLRLNEILQTALQSTQQSIANSNALLEFDVNFTNTKIQTDPDRLSQVFINLITNAVKYNDKSQPTLKISCQKDNDFLCVSFQDNGPGIPEAKHTIIFEKFTRLSNTENSSGVGLGLAISQEIMKNLGGSLICLESKIGANFQVKIPLN